MRYYVVTDIHSFYTEFMKALEEKGFFEDTEPHKLIICGDIYDRGKEAVKLQEFILDLLAKDEIILIKGNHEDLTLKLLNEWHKKSYLQYHHYSNGTIDTVCQLTGSTEEELYRCPEEVGRRLLKNDYIQKIIPAMLNYYETEHYIFVHGWIPCVHFQYGKEINEYFPLDDWRNAGQDEWDRARWINGMEAAHEGIIEEGKTIVCGHWHCSFGHAHYENDGGEFDNNPNFEPYYGDGVIGLDACTAVSKKVNCIVIDD